MVVKVSNKRLSHHVLNQTCRWFGADSLWRALFAQRIGPPPGRAAHCLAGESDPQSRPGHVCRRGHWRAGSVIHRTVVAHGANSRQWQGQHGNDAGSPAGCQHRDDRSGQHRRVASGRLRRHFAFARSDWFSICHTGTDSRHWAMSFIAGFYFSGDEFPAGRRERLQQQPRCQCHLWRSGSSSLHSLLRRGGFGGVAAKLDRDRWAWALDWPRAEFCPNRCL